MSFWKNPRYRDFESVVQDGDPLRGCPRLSLPWKVGELDYRDATGDQWLVEALCIELEPEVAGAFVSVKVEVRFVCRPSAERLARLGLAPSRLEWLAQGELEILPFSRRIGFRAKVDLIETICRAWLQREVSGLTNSVAEEQKAAAISEWLGEQRFSRFSRLD